MKFITIQKQQLQPKVVNIKSSAFYDSELNEVMETVDIQTLKEALRIPVQTINITVGKYITEVLLQTITPAYLRGSQITINGITFKPCTSNPQYFYSWTEKVPSSLPQHLKDAFKSFKLRDNLYQELVEWNQSRIKLAEEHSKFKWTFAEEFYKDIYKTFEHLRVQSPNKKTFFEANAELDFATWCPQAKPLTEAEQRNIDIINQQRYAQAFGLQSTEVQYSYRHRTTKHGTTEEITLVSDSDMENARTSASFMKHTNQQREGYTNNEGFEVFSWLNNSKSTITSHTKERENIQAIKWILNLPKETQEELLLPGWHFCPICNKLYHESEGCYTLDRNGNEITHVEEISFVPYNENHTDENEDCDD